MTTSNVFNILLTILLLPDPRRTPRRRGKYHHSIRTHLWLRSVTIMIIFVTDLHLFLVLSFTILCSSFNHLAAYTYFPLAYLSIAHTLAAPAEVTATTVTALARLSYVNDKVSRIFEFDFSCITKLLIFVWLFLAFISLPARTLLFIFDPSTASSNVGIDDY